MTPARPLDRIPPWLRPVLAGALGVPFFLLPVPLTIAAPDVYAGFGLHVRLAVLLAGLGALAGAALGWVSRWDAEHGHRLDRRAAPHLLRVLLAVLLARVIVPFSAVSQAAAIAVHRVAGSGRAPSAPETLQQPLLVAASAALLWLSLQELLAPRDLRRPPAAALAVLASPAVAFAGHWAGWLPHPSWTLPCFVLAAAPLVAPGGHGIQRLGRWLLGAAAAVLGLSLHAPGRLAAIANAPGDPIAPGVGVLLPGLLGGAVAGLALMAAVPWLHALTRRLDRVSWPTVRQALPLLPVPAFAVVSALLGRGMGSGLAELLGLPRVEGGPQLPLPPPGATLAWLVLLLTTFGEAGLDPGKRMRTRGALAVGWSLLVLASVAISALGTSSAVAVWTGVAAALLAAAAGWRRLKQLGARWVWGWSLALALTGPVALAYAEANLLPGVYPRWLVWLGLLGALGGPAFDRLLGRERRGPLSLAIRRSLWSVAGILPLFLGIAWAMWPAWVTVPGIVAIAAMLVSRLPTWRERGLPAVSTLVAGWAVFHSAFFSVIAYKAGPDEQLCAGVIDRGGARTVLRRHELGSEYRAAFPYDVLPVGEADSLVISFKRINNEGGYLEFRPLAAPSLRSRVETTPAEGNALWPERFLRAPGGLGFYVQLIGAGAHALWRVEVRPDPASGVGRLIPARELPLPWEPGNPAYDFNLRRVVVTYVPNWNSNNPLVEVFDPVDLSLSGGAPRPVQRVQISDFVAVDPVGGGYYVPAYLDLTRFAIVEIDSSSLQPTRTVETFHPTVGLAADGLRDRLWLTNPMAGTVEVWQLSSMTRLASVPAGRFPRDLEYDAARGRLHVGGYSDGQVVSFEVRPGNGELVAKDRAWVGGLLRGLGHDPGSGRLFAASGCGVFEVPLSL